MTLCWVRLLLGRLCLSVGIDRVASAIFAILRQIDVYVSGRLNSVCNFRVILYVVTTYLF